MIKVLKGTKLCKNINQIEIKRFGFFSTSNNFYF